MKPSAVAELAADLEALHCIGVRFWVGFDCRGPFWRPSGIEVVDYVRLVGPRFLSPRDVARWALVRVLAVRSGAP